MRSPPVRSPSPTASTASPDENPFSMFAGWDSDQLLLLGLLIPIAVVVFFIGSKRLRSQLGASALVPRGRDRIGLGGRHRRDQAWKATIARLQTQPATLIAAATGGAVRIVATIVSASGNLGGPRQRECIWRNRAGAGPQTAVGAALVILADDSGRCGIENIEGGRIIAPIDRAGAHYESTSLCIGDRIEIIATFERDVVGEHEDPAQLVYGTLGSDGRIEIRLLERPEPLSSSPPQPP